MRCSYVWAFIVVINLVQDDNAFVISKRPILSLNELNC